RGRGPAGQRGDLAEEITAAEPYALLARDHDLRLAIDDDEEAAAGHPLPQHALAFRKHLFADRMGDLLELGLRQVGEQRELRERLGDCSGFAWHRIANLTRWASGAHGSVPPDE